METLSVVEQHKNQSKRQGHARFESSPSKGFKDINCRTFESGRAGILPNPFKSRGPPKTPYNSDKKWSVKAATPKSNPIPINGKAKACGKETSFTEDVKTPYNSDKKWNVKAATPKSNPIPINGKAKACGKETSFTEDVPGGTPLLSELWAGPTYSNSPPPSSLPIPKFFVRSKKTVPLNLPGSSPDIEMGPVAKSAPSASITKHLHFTKDLFVNADSATTTLRRVLNLNINDD